MIILIPIRSGSKRIKHKNIFKINQKKRLFEYTLDLINKLNLKDITYISTDSNFVINYCKKNKFNFIKRPKKFATSVSPIEETVIHLQKKLKFNNIETILLLQVTSPLRSVLSTKKFISMSQNLLKKYDTIISVTESKKDIWFWNKNYGQRFLKNEPRNQLIRKSIFEEDGLFYLFKFKNLIKKKSILGSKIFLYKSKENETLDINDKKDLDDFKKRINV